MNVQNLNHPPTSWPLFPWYLPQTPGGEWGWPSRELQLGPRRAALVAPPYRTSPHGTAFLGRPGWKWPHEPTVRKNATWEGPGKAMGSA